VAIDRSDKAYEYWRDASLRFDYFMTGGTGALAAYVGQTIKPHRIGFNAESLELLALLLLIGSVAAGLKYIHEGVEILKKMHKRLFHGESSGTLRSAATGNDLLINKATGDIVHPQQLLLEANLHKERGEEIETEIEGMQRVSVKYYKRRNRLLLVGFLLLIVAKILPAYRTLEPNMTSHEPTPIERTQLIEIALNTYQAGAPNLVQINDLDHQIAKIDSAMGNNAEVSARLKDLQDFISLLKHARATKSLEVEENSLASARAANSALQQTIAANERSK
jgi:hypothetical protein